MDLELVNAGRFLTNQVWEQLIHPTFREGSEGQGKWDHSTDGPNQALDSGSCAGKKAEDSAGEAHGSDQSPRPRMQMEKHGGESVG